MRMPISSSRALAASSRCRRPRRRPCSRSPSSCSCWRSPARASASSCCCRRRRSALPEPRRFREPRLLIATNNRGKLAEIDDLLRPFRIEVVGAGALGLPEPEETGYTFEANASLKAHAAAEASGLPALAADSGLVIPALGGEPGIYSARWGGPRRDFSLAMQTVEDRLRGKPDRHAHFVAVLALPWPHAPPQVFPAHAPRLLLSPPPAAPG